MKDQLTNYKTQYDIRGDYNRKGLFEAKKQAYQQEINFSVRADDVTERNFALKPLEIGFVQSLTLKDDPKFKQIQKIFVKYNTQVLELGQRAINGLHLKTVVMESMLKFLRVIMLAPDATCKKNLLDVAYYWLMKHLHPKTQKKSAQNYIKEIKQIIVQTKQLPIEIIEKQLPSTKLKNQLYEYKIRARTMHDDLDAPEFQLQNYRQKQILVEPAKKHEQTQEQRRRIRLLRVKFPKPNLQQYYQSQQQLPKEQKPIDPQQISEVPLGNPPIIGQDGLPKVQNAEEAVNVGKSPEEIAQMQMLNQMGGEPEEPQEAVVEQEDDKTKGKLDPFVKLFLRKQQEEKMSRTFQHPPINYRQKYKNNYQQLLKREDENFSRNMAEWASKRSKLKTQMSRKVQSMRMFNSSLNKTSIKFQEDFSKVKINQTIRGNKYYIRNDLVRDNLNTEVGLSCFDRKRAKTESTKPFSSILQENKRINKRQQYLDEINQIKLNFAKNKIFTSMHAMKNGLMHPEQKQEGDIAEKIQYPTSLLSNPFFVVKKKKKKGKKKK